MKTFGELTFEERNMAVERAKDLLIGLVIEGVIEIEMPNHIVQSQFERILSDGRKSENMKLARELLVNHVTINRELDKISIASAEGARYDNNGGLLVTH